MIHSSIGNTARAHGGEQAQVHAGEGSQRARWRDDQNRHCARARLTMTRGGWECGWQGQPRHVVWQPTRTWSACEGDDPGALAWTSVSHAWWRGGLGVFVRGRPGRAAARRSCRVVARQVGGMRTTRECGDEVARTCAGEGSSSTCEDGPSVWQRPCVAPIPSRKEATHGGGHSLNLSTPRT